MIALLGVMDLGVDDDLVVGGVIMGIGSTRLKEQYG